jgi:hypothetical protein
MTRLVVSVSSPKGPPPKIRGLSSAPPSPFRRHVSQFDFPAAGKPSALRTTAPTPRRSIADFGDDDVAVKDIENVPPPAAASAVAAAATSITSSNSSSSSISLEVSAATEHRYSAVTAAATHRAGPDHLAAMLLTEPPGERVSKYMHAMEHWETKTLHRHLRAWRLFTSHQRAQRVHGTVRALRHWSTRHAAAHFDAWRDHVARMREARRLELEQVRQLEDRGRYLSRVADLARAKTALSVWRSALAQRRTRAEVLASAAEMWDRERTVRVAFRTWRTAHAVSQRARRCEALADAHVELRERAVVREALAAWRARARRGAEKRSLHAVACAHYARRTLRGCLVALQDNADRAHALQVLADRHVHGREQRGTPLSESARTSMCLHVSFRAWRDAALRLQRYMM